MSDDNKSTSTEETKSEVIKGGYSTVTPNPPQNQSNGGNWGTAVPADTPSQPSTTTPKPEE